MNYALCLESAIVLTLLAIIGIIFFHFIREQLRGK